MAGSSLISGIVDGFCETSKDVLLANIMVYVCTNTFSTSTWIYYGRREEGGRFFPKDFKKIDIPTAIAVFPKEMSQWPPKSYVDRKGAWQTHFRQIMSHICKL